MTRVSVHSHHTKDRVIYVDLYEAFRHNKSFDVVTDQMQITILNMDVYAILPLALAIVL